ncbi:uncharacterized protein LOC134477121 isoform X3 [Cavia porcellus]|uniref:uncharacterized protein LOC134477121 isoform X3 n=1 Tax=Cavia porcellus TaxID=10141 RepID=UPI002FE0FC6D
MAKPRPQPNPSSPPADRKRLPAGQLGKRLQCACERPGAPGEEGSAGGRGAARRAGWAVARHVAKKQVELRGPGEGAEKREGAREGKRGREEGSERGEARPCFGGAGRVAGLRSAAERRCLAFLGQGGPGFPRRLRTQSFSRAPRVDVLLLTLRRRRPRKMVSPRVLILLLSWAAGLGGQYGNPLNKYIRHYEGLSYNVDSLHQRHQRAKRAVSHEDQFLRLDFHALGRSSCNFFNRSRTIPDLLA